MKKIKKKKKINQKLHDGLSKLLNAISRSSTTDDKKQSKKF